MTVYVSHILLIDPISNYHHVDVSESKTDRLS